MKTRLLPFAAFISVSALVPVQAAESQAYVTDSYGEIVRDNYGSCVRSINWTKEIAIPKCEGWAEPKPEVKPAPVVVAKPKPVVVGHTDSTGSAAYNQQLSEKRAEAVKSYLTDKDVQSDRITTQGAGESQPIANNKTKEGRAQNRRVEIEILK